MTPISPDCYIASVTADDVCANPSVASASYLAEMTAFTDTFPDLPPVLQLRGPIKIMRCMVFGSASDCFEKLK